MKLALISDYGEVLEIEDDIEPSKLDSVLLKKIERIMSIQFARELDPEYWSDFSSIHCLHVCYGCDRKES